MVSPGSFHVSARISNFSTSLLTCSCNLVITVPVVDTTPEEPPPFVVVVHGPPGVGKTTLIKNLIKHYVNQNLSEVKGPITVVSGKTRRLTFVECPQVSRIVVTVHRHSGPQT